MSGPRTPTQADIYISDSMGAAIAVFGLASLFWSLSARYTWDALGLHWRTWGRWSHVAWDQITNYYILPVQGNKPQKLLVVETTTATRRIPTYLWTGHAELQTAIVDEATAAHVREWSVKGLRPGDPPRTFEYRLQDRLFTIGSILIALGYLAAFLVQVSLKIYSTAALIGVWWAVAECAMVLLLIVAVGAMWAVPVLPYFQAFRRRETIITTPEGITSQSRAGTITATWPEIRKWSYVNLSKTWEVPVACEIVTDRGSFSFALAIHDRSALIAILQEKAGDAFQARSHERILRADPAKYGISTRDQSLTRLYHYKTRTMRIMVAGLFVLVCAVAAVMEVNRWVSASRPLPLLLHVAIYIAVIVGLGWVWRQYQNGGVITDDDAITKLTPPYRHSIAWRDLTECRYDAELEQIRLRGTRSKMNISLWIADASDLIDEIEERAPQAEMIGMDRRAVKSASTN